MRHFHDGRYAGSVIDRAMVDLVAVLWLTDAEMVPMRGEDHILVGFFRAFQNANDILRIGGPDFVPHFDGSFDAERNRLEILLECALLHVVEIKTRGFEEVRRNLP